MSTLHEKLLARIDRIDALHGNNTHAAIAPLRAVVELHAPFEGRCTECVEYCDCAESATCEHGNAEEPCRTITAIASALGVEIGETP